MTVKGYLRDPYQTAFQAIVTEVGQEESGASYAVLDQTWFYPEGGGQPADRGLIGGVPVTDVQVAGRDVRHSLGDRSDLRVGETVSCEVDWERRFDLMQQHHAQHLLSAVLDDQFGAPTASVHLGSDLCAIEVSRDDLTEDEIQRAFDQVNAWIQENRVITSMTVTRQEADRYPLRKTPAVEGDVRLVIVEGIDVNPCGGTHPARTGEVQLVHFTGYERARGGLRITYLAGGRVSARMRHYQRIADDVSRLLNSPFEEIPDVLQRQLDANRRLEKELQAMKQEQLETLFADWLKKAEAEQAEFVPFMKEGLGMKELQKLSAKAVQALPAKLLLFATAESGHDGARHLQFVLTAGRDCTADLKDVEKRLFALIDGKGGGSSVKVQGGGRTALPLESFVRQVSDMLQLEN